MNNIYLLSDKKFSGVYNLPVFEVKFIKLDIDISLYDALIFTSKNALYSLKSHNIKWKGIPSYAIAPQTAMIINDFGGKLEFTGNSNHGDKFALELLKPLKGKKVLFLKGTKNVSKLSKILNENQIKCDEIVVYESICKDIKEQKTLPPNSIIIFSSPTTIKCFLKNFNWDDSFSAIAIGETTSKYFPEYIKPFISEDTTIKSCIKKAQDINI